MRNWLSELFCWLVTAVSPSKKRGEPLIGPWGGPWNFNQSNTNL